MEPMWTLDTALALIRALQPRCRALFYHATLGGGVLNRGHSVKDLDLYFLPFNDTADPEPAKLRSLLQTVLGEEFHLGGPTVQLADIALAYPPQANTFSNGRYTYRKECQRVDVFIA